MPETSNDSSVSTHLPLKRQIGSWVIPVTVLGATLIVTASVTTYYVATAETRSREARAESAAKVERAATGVLHALADEEAASMWKKGRDGSAQLDGGNWAKEKFVPENVEWEIKKTGSDGCPFEGTITLPFTRYATVYRSSKEAAEKDSQYFPAADESFYPDQRGYQSEYPSRYKKTLVLRLLYDPESGWKVRSKKSE